jgi:hypothetical protein
MNDETFTLRLGRRSLALLALLTGLALLAGPLSGSAAAHVGHTITIEASEDCPNRTYCFEVTSDSLDDVAPGEETTIKYVNPDSNSLNHNLKVTTKAKADTDNRDTANSAAFAETENLEPGERTELNFTVPAASDGIYLWCGVGVHEEQGMYRMVSFGSAEDSGNDGGSQNGSPGPGALVAVLGAAGAAVALRRD